MIGVLLGPPGSGKGTQAELIAPVLGVPHISTGELLRAESEAMTPLGAEVAPLLAAGELVPDELIERVLEQRLRAPDAARGARRRGPRAGPWGPCPGPRAPPRGIPAPGGPGRGPGRPAGGGGGPPRV